MSDPLSQICVNCSQIFSGKKGLLNWRSRSINHTGNVTDLSKNCKLCENIRRVLSSGDMEVVPFNQPTPVLESLSMKSFKISFTPVWKDKSLVTMKISAKDCRTHLFTVTADPESPASDFVSTRSPIYDVGSNENFELVHSWSEECWLHHNNCRRHSSFFPKRVIDVSSSLRSLEVQLKQDLVATEPPPRYATLSYCWGKGPNNIQLTTTNATLPNRLQKICINSLPKTIQDAVLVVRKMNIRYLWVDAICIVQDDKDDLREQIEVMGDIYSNSFCTILAANSDGCGEGFLSPRLNSSFQIPYRGPDGTTSLLNFPLIAETQDQIWNPLPIEEPLHTRAWAFQETILSHRLLIFSEKQTYWKCQTHSESRGLPSPRHYFSRTGLSAFLYNAGLDNLQIRVKDHPGENVVLRQMTEAWLRMIESYSRREITYFEDRGPAFAGIAKRYRRPEDDQYVAGVCASTLEIDLIWGCDLGSIRKRPKNEFGKNSKKRDVLPSWSWMAYDGPVSYNSIIVHLKVHRVFETISLPRPDALGWVATGSKLVLRGRTIDILVPPGVGVKGTLAYGHCYLADLWDSARKCYKKTPTEKDGIGHMTRDEFDVNPDATLNAPRQDFSRNPTIMRCFLIALVTPNQPSSKEELPASSVDMFEKTSMWPSDFLPRGLIIERQEGDQPRNQYRRRGLFRGSSNALNYFKQANTVDISFC